jgi:hypothetical protein
VNEKKSTEKNRSMDLKQKGRCSGQTEAGYREDYVGKLANSRIMNIDILLHALTSYFVIIDPIGTAVLFHTLTDGSNREYRLRMAIRR